MFDKITIKDMDVNGKKVLLRVDYNVPLNSNLQITNDKRIRETLPTINYLIENGAKIIIATHLGRPDGKPLAEFSLKPVAQRLSELLQKPVILTGDVAGVESYKYVRTMKPGDIVMLENLRFDARETEDDAEFAKDLIGLADIYCNDAFGTMHRKHTSTHKITDYLPSCIGLLVEKELAVFDKVLSEPDRPFVVVIGGAKIQDKIGLISHLIDVADIILIGGAMSYTFLKAQGVNVGRSIIEKDKLQLARLLLEKAKIQNVKVVLPTDHIVAGEFSFDAECMRTDNKRFPRAGIGMDIGPSTIRAFEHYIARAHTVLWNGPLGVAEFHKFSEGTNRIAMAIANSKAFSIIGGGDSAKFIEQLGLQNKINHISTGGGASLKLLESGTLPGLECIPNRS